MAGGVIPETTPVNVTPAKDLDGLYKFTDWAEKCLPWKAIEGHEGDGVYEHVDQPLANLSKE